MHLSTLAVAAVACFAPATEAYLHTLGFPSTIQAGVPFDVYYEQYSSQPRDHNLIFGIKKDNGFVSKSEIGSDIFLSAYIKDLLPGGGFNGTLASKLTIPARFEHGPAVVTVLITEFSGLFNGAGFVAIHVPVTIGDTTSTERSFGSRDDENAVSWVVSDSA